MFEIDEVYDIDMFEGAIDQGITTFFGMRVVKVDGPRIAVIADGHQTIINTTSHAFVQAKRRIE
jgi:hypothetical protein